MNSIHPSIVNISMPDRMRNLPITPNGWPALYFAAVIDGEVDLRVADLAKFKICVEGKRCWLCGESLGVNLAVVIGPMCAINRTTAEPPQHYECAAYAVRACPFLTRPKMLRNETQMPENRIPAPGLMLKRNPGCAGIWVTKSVKPYRVPEGVPEGVPDVGRGILFELGEAVRVEWYCEGRQATRREVVDSISSGLPYLLNMIHDEDEAIAFGRMMADTWELLPKD